MGTAGFWLDVPDPPLFRDDHLPDPYRMIGGHVLWVCIQGIPLTHQAWTATHGGQCPPGCTKLPDGAPAQPDARSPAWDAWHAFMRGMPRLPERPAEPPETGVTLQNRGGWNQYSCVPDDGPMLRIDL